VSSNGIDPETLAAFLDGKLSGQEREKVIKALSDSELYESFMEASAIQRELGMGEVPEPVVVVDARDRFARSRRWRTYVPAAAAAALAGVLAVSQFASARMPESLGLVAKAAFFEQAQENGAQKTLGADWKGPAWSASRGVNSPETPRGDEFKSGVLLVNLDFAARTKEDTVFPRIATQLKKLVSGPASNMLNPADKTSLRGFSRTISQLFKDSPWYRLGIWTGQARLAVAGNDMSFFAPDSKATRMLTDVYDRITDDAKASGDTSTDVVVGQLKFLLGQINNRQLTDTAARSSVDGILDDAAVIQ